MTEQETLKLAIKTIAKAHGISFKRAAKDYEAFRGLYTRAMERQKPSDRGGIDLVGMALRLSERIDELQGVGELSDPTYSELKLFFSLVIVKLEQKPLDAKE